MMMEGTQQTNLTFIAGKVLNIIMFWENDQFNSSSVNHREVDTEICCFPGSFPDSHTSLIDVFRVLCFHFFWNQ